MANIIHPVIKRDTCMRCRCTFAYVHTTAIRKYCKGCCLVVTREKNALRIERYRQTLKGRANTNRRMREYYHTPEGKVNSIKYYLSLKGKAKTARMNAKRRKWSTNPGLYAVRLELLRTVQEPCAKCGALFEITHEIDHIVALSLGGTDEWSNMQPLCFKCHKEKTGEDNHKLAVRRHIGELI